MSTNVLVPGMNHGGWCFDDLVERLRAEGHTVHALTLPGLAPGDDVSGVDLETHIAEAAAAWEMHALESKHNVMRDVPEKLAAILLDVA